MSEDKQIVLFESADGIVSLPVQIDTVSGNAWLNRGQMALLYDRDVKTIGKHINNALKEELCGSKDTVVAKIATTAADGKTYQVEHYSIDVVLSVGYRVKSQRGIEFRRWATDVLRHYIVGGHAENARRLEQLGQVASIMARIPDDLDTRQVIDIVQSYTATLDVLDDYDHQRLAAPKGSAATYVLTYEECREVIDSMRFGDESDLFGVEKDDSFKGSIGNIYQSFGGQEIYPTLQEKAANLPYFVVKNHGFLDGNKRIAATMIEGSFKVTKSDLEARPVWVRTPEQCWRLLHFYLQGHGFREFAIGAVASRGHLYPHFIGLALYKALLHNNLPSL